MKRFIDTTPSHLFLTPERPIYVNRVAESFELAEHNHEFMEINYVSEGSGFQHIEGQTLAVTKGDLFFLPVGVAHVFRPAYARPKRGHLIVYNCLFGEAFIRKLSESFAGDDGMLDLLRTPYPGQPWLHWRDRDGTFQSIFRSLFDEFARKRQDYLLVMQTEIVKLLVHMRRCLSAAPGSERGPEPSATAATTDESMERVIERIQERAADPPPILELASMAGLSERQFRRRFVMRTGMNYTDYIQQLRIEHICRLLVSTSELVSTIARRAGYEDMKHFNRLFKKKTGLTPKEYRIQQSLSQHLS